jgi:hypothetical protein
MLNLKPPGCVLQCWTWNHMAVFCNVEIKMTLIYFTILKPNGPVLQCWNRIALFYNVETKLLCFAMLKPKDSVLQYYKKNGSVYNFETKYLCFTMTLLTYVSLIAIWLKYTSTCTFPHIKRSPWHKENMVF